eukprot:5712936-Amphidinium_carterae.3
MGVPELHAAASLPVTFQPAYQTCYHVESALGSRRAYTRGNTTKDYAAVRYAESALATRGSTSVAKERI